MICPVGSSVRLLEDAKLALKLEREASGSSQSSTAGGSNGPSGGYLSPRGNLRRKRSAGRDLGNAGRGPYGAIPGNGSERKEAVPRSTSSDRVPLVGRGATSTFEALGSPVKQHPVRRSGSSGRLQTNASGNGSPRKGSKRGSTEMVPILTGNGRSSSPGGSAALEEGRNSSNDARGFLAGRDQEDEDEDCDEEPAGDVQMAILDFSGATGLDASAARSCFHMLKQVLRVHGIRCVFVVSSPDIRALLVAHQVIAPPSISEVSFQT